MNVQAFLFDLDGVITESSTAHFQAWKEVAKAHYIDIPNSFESELKGISRKESTHRILAYAKKTWSEEAIQAFMDEKNNRYLDLIRHYTKANRLPGVAEIFALAKAHHLKTALVSASQNAPLLLRALSMDDWFDVRVDPTLYPSKPAPDLFLAAAKALNVAPEACIGFEDAKAGLTAIQAAGMTAVGIGNADLDADFVFPNLKEATHALSTHL